MYDSYNAQFSQSQPGGSQHPILAPRPLYLPPTGAAGHVSTGTIQLSEAQATNAAPFYYPTAAPTGQTQGFVQTQNFAATQPVPATTGIAGTVTGNGGYQDAWVAPSGQPSYQPMLHQQYPYQTPGVEAPQLPIVDQGVASHQPGQTYSAGAANWEPTHNSQVCTLLI